MQLCLNGPILMIKIGKGLGDIAETTLRFFKQIGVEEVSMPTQWNENAGTGGTTRPFVPPTQTGPRGRQSPIWDEDLLMRIRDRIESFGLIPREARLGLSGNILLGKDGRDEDLEVVKANIEIAEKHTTSGLDL